MNVMCAHDELVDIDMLIPNPRNPNKHPDSQIKLLAKIMAHQGWRSPIVISNRSGFIIKGHGRLMAANLNKWQQAPVDRQDYENEADEYADMVADNKIAELSDTDLSMVLSDVLEFGPDFDFDLLGIPDFKLPEEFEPQSDEDSVPEHVEPRTKLGDIYTLGRHRLMCGDSTSIDAVEKLVDGERADMVFTSPPYGVNLDYNSYDDSFENTLSVVQSVILTMSKITDGYICLNWCDIVSGKIINKSEFPSQYSWLPIYNQTLNALGFYLWGQRIWKKPHARVSAPWSASSNRPVTDWEYLFTWSNGKQRSNSRQNESHFGVVDSSDSGQSDTLKDHPGAFPVFVGERMINVHSDETFIIVDPFGGSGTTMIACEKTNRTCYMMELDPHYCDVIVARWEKYTGQTGELLNEQTRT